MITYILILLIVAIAVRFFFEEGFGECLAVTFGSSVCAGIFFLIMTAFVEFGGGLKETHRDNL